MIGAGSAEKRYELVERIAVGGMAEVFRAKAYGSHGFEKVLAIKRILPGLAADPKFERRFIAEAKLAVSLSHANIVQVLDFSRFGQSLYIVMEFVDGGDLARVLHLRREQGAPVPLSAAVHIAVELLKGLDFAHRRGVVHRDVSPSNILLSRAGEVKIADFGIAQAVGFEHSRSMRIMGKWRYMSPEQAQGEDLDARSDVFSAGVVLHELLTGQRLFPGNDAEEIVRNLRTMPLPRPSQVRADLPPEMDAPLAAALERDRAARTISSAQLLSALVEVCYARSLPAMPTELARFLDEIAPAGAGDEAAPPLTAGSDSASVPAARRPGNQTGSNSIHGVALLDEIISSELHPRRADRARAARRAGRVRRTAVALGPPAMAAEDLPREPTGDPAAPPGEGTFILSVADLDGTTHWELDDAPGPDDAPVTDDDELDSVDEDDDITRAVEAVAPDTPGPVFLPPIVEPGTRATRSGPSGSRPEPEPPPSPSPPRRRRWIAAVTIGAAVAAGAGFLAWRASGVAGERGVMGAERGAPGAERGEPGEPAVTQPAVARAGDATAPAEAPRTESSAIDEPGVAPRTEVTAPAPEPAPRTEDGAPAPEPDAARPAGVSAPPPRARGGRPERARSSPRERATATGAIDIYSEPWANIYLGKRKVGVAPQRGVKLPVGRHRLHLVNPVLERSTWVTVSVPSTRPVRVELPE